MFFGVAVFTFEGNGVILSLHNSMKEPDYFQRVLKILITIIICVVVIVPSVAYCVRKIIKNSFDRDMVIQ